MTFFSQNFLMAFFQTNISTKHNKAIREKLDGKYKLNLEHIFLWQVVISS